MPAESQRRSNIVIPSVDPSSPIPLYHQIESDLRRRILTGEFEPGEVVPPEHDLSRDYGVSRHTVRAAMARLAADRLISRSAGRGTFVLPPPDRVRFSLDRSFTQQMADLGRRAHSKVLRAEAGTIEDDDPAPLRPQLGSPCFRLVRLRFGDDEPIGIQNTTVLTRRCPDLAQHDFNEESLYSLLTREYGLVVTRIHHVVSAAAADPEQADLLLVAAGDPLLVVQTTALLGGSEILEHTTSHYRADRYEYSVMQTP